MTSTTLLGQVPSNQEAASRGEELTVYLMTMGPGAYVWERFGHNAIRIRDSVRGTDIAYNYGMFSFDQENFLLRFIRGQMDYWMEGFDALLTANAYARQDRSVWVQELNLSPAQRADLRDFLEWNARPENRFYRYDYYRDNCSTRVRDAIDRVLGGQIREQTEALPTGETYRTHTERLTAGDALLYTGLLIGLGQPVDREISAWEEMFLPMEMRSWAREVTIVDEAGVRVPLVRAEETVNLAATDDGAAPAEVPDRFAGYLFIGLLAGAGIAASGHYSRRRRDVAVAFKALTGAWAGIAGLLGLVLLSLWALTDHSVAYRNENLFFLNPLILPLTVLLPLAVRRERAADAAWKIAAAVAGIAIVGTLVKVLPAFDQQNAELIALVLPVELAIALAAWWLKSSPTRGPGSAAARQSAAPTALAA